MDKWFKDILTDKDPYHNRGRDPMRRGKKGGPEFECLWLYTLFLISFVRNDSNTFISVIEIF
jgi:hypothetical protein